jgi:hypothetical protein
VRALHIEIKVDDESLALVAVIFGELEGLAGAVERRGELLAVAEVVGLMQGGGDCGVLGGGLG